MRFNVRQRSSRTQWLDHLKLSVHGRLEYLGDRTVVMNFGGRLSDAVSTSADVRKLYYLISLFDVRPYS